MTWSRDKNEQTINVDIDRRYIWLNVEQMKLDLVTYGKKFGIPKAKEDFESLIQFLWDKDRVETTYQEDVLISLREDAKE